MSMADAELRMRTVSNGSIESKAKSQGQMRDVIFNLDMWTFAMLCLTLPATALVICFVTGFLFRFEEVNETMCGVKNYIPSISAVTGITPQTYLWRTCIGLQSAPRLAVCFFYYNQYRNKMHQVAPHRLSLFQKLIRLNFWLNFVENSCLILVAFITNRENYLRQEPKGEEMTALCCHQRLPSLKRTGETKKKKIVNWVLALNLIFTAVKAESGFRVYDLMNAWWPEAVHEKIFVVFMVTSLCYMLLNNILFKWSREGHSTELELRSYWWKKVMFAVNIVATSGLIFFFIQHRVFCIHGAFSWFSFCEYFIAYGNMAYHFTGYLDFKGLTVVCGDFSSGASATSNGTTEHIVNNNTGQRTKSH